MFSPHRSRRSQIIVVPKIIHKTIVTTKVIPHEIKTYVLNGKTITQDEYDKLVKAGKIDASQTKTTTHTKTVKLPPKEDKS